MYESHVDDFLLHCLIVEKFVLDCCKHLILLVLVNSRVEPFNFCTHSLDFFSYNVESLSSNVVFSFEPVFMILLNIFFQVVNCSQSRNHD